MRRYLVLLVLFLSGALAPLAWLGLWPDQPAVGAPAIAPRSANLAPGDDAAWPYHTYLPLFAPGTAPSCRELLTDGGFEAGGAWVRPPSASQAGYATGVAHSGSRSMRLGLAPGDPAQLGEGRTYSNIFQTVSIPGEGGVTLSFAYNAGAEDPGEVARGEDFRRALILDGSNHQVLDVLTLAFDDDRAWHLLVFDVNPYRGRTIDVAFTVFNYTAAEGSRTWLYLDDVTLETCPAAVPTRTATATASSAPLPSATGTATPTALPLTAPPVEATHTPTITPEPSSTPVEAATATVTFTPTPAAPPSTGTATPSPTPTLIPVATRTPAATPTATAFAFWTHTPTPTVTGTATATPQPTATPTRTAVPTPTPVPGCTELLLNGGFEQDDSWVFAASASQGYYTELNRHTGYRSAFLGLITGAAMMPASSSTDSTVYQTVSIPPGSDVAALSVWYYPATEDVYSGDYQRVLVLDGLTHEIIGELMRVHEDDRAWKNATFDMAPYRNAQVDVAFQVRNNSTGPTGRTWMYVDDISLTLCPAAAP